ncbi:MAG TPA: carboxypeptidase-like regulatory domain-containing protein [Bacteroidetes bacterium]|nr:carboxypeptidase-like regulatory domain-containing protein [Bacteroidota bacterium]
MKRIPLVTLFCFLVFTALSQSAGVIISSETLEPIPFANISKKGSSFGTTSNENGKFNVCEQLKGAVVIVSAIGFEQQQFTISDKQDTIYLTPKQYELKEVVVRPTGERKEVIVNPISRKRTNYTLFSNGYAWIVAKHFSCKPEYNATPYIKEIRVSTQSKIKDAKFNVRLLSVNHKGEPSDEVFGKNIIASAKKGKKNTTINFEMDTVAFPEDGLFVALEWLIVEANAHAYSYTVKGSKKKHKGIMYQPHFSVFKKEGESPTWIYYGANWHQTGLTPNANEYLDLLIELTLTNQP